MVTLHVLSYGFAMGRHAFMATDGCDVLQNASKACLHVMSSVVDQKYCKTASAVKAYSESCYIGLPDKHVTQQMHLQHKTLFC